MPQEKLSIPSTFNGQHKSFQGLISWHLLNNHLHTRNPNVCCSWGLYPSPWLEQMEFCLYFILYMQIASFVSKKEIQLNSYSYKKQHKHFLNQIILYETSLSSLLPLLPLNSPQTSGNELPSYCLKQPPQREKLLSN